MSIYSDSAAVMENQRKMIERLKTLLYNALDIIDEQLDRDEYELAKVMYEDIGMVEDEIKDMLDDLLYDDDEKDEVIQDIMDGLEVCYGKKED